MQGRYVKTGRFFLGAIVLGSVMACSPTYRYHGYVPTDDELANVLVGADTRATVAEVLGRPSSTGLMDDGGWYYLASKVENFTYHAPKVVERQMVAVSFDGNGVVTNIERFGLEDGRVVTLSRRVTDTGAKGPGFFKQLLGNLGNFSAADAIANGS